MNTPFFLLGEVASERVCVQSEKLFFFSPSFHQFHNYLCLQNICHSECLEGVHSPATAASSTSTDPVSLSDFF